MSEREKEILKSIVESTKQMTEEQKIYFDGIGAGMAIAAGFAAGVKAEEKEEGNE